MIKTNVVLATLVPAMLAIASPAFAQTPPAAPLPISDCLQTRSIQQAEAAADRHWYARMRDGKWYRNTMECPSLAPGRALIHSSPIGSQCRGDIVQVVDFTMGGISFGGCGLGGWQQVEGLPAKRAKKK